MVTTRYSDQRDPNRDKKLCGSTSNGTDQYQNGSSNLLTPYREQPRITSGRNPPSYCITLTLIAMQGHQQKGRQTSTSSNNKDKSNTIIETSTAEDHDDENLHNPSTRPRYSPGSRRRAVGDHTRRYEASGKNWVPRSITCQGYDTQMLLMHGRSYGPALTRNTKERASVYQSDKVGLRPLV